MKRIKSLLTNIMAVLSIAIAMNACTSTKVVSEADMIKHKIAIERLQTQEFTIKADRLILDKRSFPSVSPATNFIQVDGGQAIVQISPANGGGPNGVGGFTVKGSVSGYEAKEKSNGGMTVKFNVTAPVGSCMVFINVPKDGYIANATVHNTLRGKNATIYGNVTPIDHTVFVGRSR